MQSSPNNPGNGWVVFVRNAGTAAGTVTPRPLRRRAARVRVRAILRTGPEAAGRVPSLADSQAVCGPRRSTASASPAATASPTTSTRAPKTVMPLSKRLSDGARMQVRPGPVQAHDPGPSSCSGPPAVSRSAATVPTVVVVERVAAHVEQRTGGGDRPHKARAADRRAAGGRERHASLRARALRQGARLKDASSRPRVSLPRWTRQKRPLRSRRSMGESAAFTPDAAARVGRVLGLHTFAADSWATRAPERGESTGCAGPGGAIPGPRCRGLTGRKAG